MPKYQFRYSISKIDKKKTGQPHHQRPSFDFRSRPAAGHKEFNSQTNLPKMETHREVFPQKDGKQKKEENQKNPRTENRSSESNPA
jgi:hypothetical protein